MEEKIDPLLNIKEGTSKNNTFIIMGNYQVNTSTKTLTSNIFSNRMPKVLKEYFIIKKIKIFCNRIKILWIKAKPRLTGLTSRFKRLNKNNLSIKLISREARLKTRDHKNLQITETSWIIKSRMELNNLY